MQKAVEMLELIISHGAGWLIGIAGVMHAYAALRKSSAPNAQTQPKQTRPSAQRLRREAIAPDTSLAAWRRAVTRAIRPHLIMLAINGLFGAGLAFITPAVTPRFIAFELFTLFSMFASWFSMHRAVDALERRWRA